MHYAKITFEDGTEKFGTMERRTKIKMEGRDISVISLYGKNEQMLVYADTIKLITKEEYFAGIL